MNRPAEGIHDRIFAKAVVLADGKKKFALLTVDIVGFPPPIKPALVDRLSGGMAGTREQIMLLPSHSHTSIEMNAINPANTLQVPQLGIYSQRVYDFVVERLASVVQDAERQLVPVSVGTSSISIDGWNRNRRGGDVTDKELTVTRVDTVAGKPLAVLVNFTAHPTFMSGEDMLFSGDWPGHLHRTLESLIGEAQRPCTTTGPRETRPRSAAPTRGPVVGNVPNATVAIWASSPGGNGNKRHRRKTSLLHITSTPSRARAQIASRFHENRRAPSTDSMKNCSKRCYHA